MSDNKLNIYYLPGRLLFEDILDCEFIRTSLFVTHKDKIILSTTEESLYEPSLEALNLFSMEHYKPEIRYPKKLRQEDSGKVDKQQERSDL